MRFAYQPSKILADSHKYTGGGHLMITTFQQHILQQQRDVPYASGDFSWLLSGITLAAKMIEAKIRCAGLCNIVGTAGQAEA
jgi:fructose-1,6-bisphosphatase